LPARERVTSESSTGTSKTEILKIEQVSLEWGHSMFEPWEKFDAKKAASMMNKHRKMLRREHACVRKLLRRKLKDQTPTDITEQVNALRQIWRDALKDQIRVCNALNREFFVINFATYVTAFQAQSRLFVKCNEVAQTVQQLSPTSIGHSKSGSVRPNTR
jgi:hypothetical protein